MYTQAELWLEIAWAAAKFLNGFYDRNGEVATSQIELVTKLIARIFVSVKFEDGCSSVMGPCTSRSGDSRNLV